MRDRYLDLKKGYSLWIGQWTDLKLSSNVTDVLSGIIKCQKHVQLPIRMSAARECLLSPVSWWHDCCVIKQKGG